VFAGTLQGKRRPEPIWQKFQWELSTSCTNVWSDEVWSHLKGDPLLLYCFNAEKREVYRIRLGKLEGARSPFMWSQRASGELPSR